MTIVNKDWKKLPVHNVLQTLKQQVSRIMYFVRVARNNILFYTILSLITFQVLFLVALVAFIISHIFHKPRREVYLLCLSSSKHLGKGKSITLYSYLEGRLADILPILGEI